MKQNKIKNIIIYCTIVSLLIFIISYALIVSKSTHITNNIYKTQLLKIEKKTKFLVDSKQQETLALALVLSKDKSIIKALQENKYEHLNLNNLATTLNIFNSFKHIWFHIIDKNGNSFYRSWVKKRGDNVSLIRKDVSKILKDKKIISTISVGKFDITFKSIVPIYSDEGFFIGLFEIITHFNSVAKALEKDNYGVVVVANKRYKSQITHPITNLFIDDYYVANFDIKKDVIYVLKSIGIDNILNHRSNYIVDKDLNMFIVKYKINNKFEDGIGYIFILKKLDSFDFTNINTIKRNIILIALLFVSLFIGLCYYIINKNTKEKLNKKLLDTNQEKKVLDAILSAQPYIIILLYNNRIDYVNKLFFDFFTQYNTIEEFVKENKCICSFFVDKKTGDNVYVTNRDDWLKRIINQSEHKVCMLNNNIQRDFIIRATKPKIEFIEEELTILTLVDITDMNKKDQLLYEQTKLASMGEMIGNIAHQWRQPLSFISTTASGMMMKKEYDMLTDEEFYSSCEAIDLQVQYLSKTIDDFRNFIKGDQEKAVYNVKDTIMSALRLVNGSIVNYNIELILDLKENIKINGYENELEQSLINIFNNAKDALKENNIKDKMIFISLDATDNDVVIKIKDNAGGIPKDVLPRIFEPYFTTKHKSQGTGLGLHMTYRLVVDGMKGKIEAKNSTTIYKDQEYVGAEFIITLPKSIKEEN